MHPARYGRLERPQMLVDRRVQTGEGPAFVVRRPVKRIARTAERVQQRLLKKRLDMTFGIAAGRQQA